TNLSSIANTIKDELIRANPGRHVEFNITEDMFVIGDSQLIRIALENLLNNAFKFTRLNPQASIEFGVIDHEGKQIFFIRDNGVGFEMEYADKLFAPFQRLHSENEFEGTGIGLAIVHRIISKHGGRIWAEAEPGKGAIFYFTLR
ncbi:MAG: ATP-binding protein, partial [Syntrophorhabdaceae bacterium]|nr:ATP-binding protein [Syntrophorhabdaceae bacterium]